MNALTLAGAAASTSDRVSAAPSIAFVWAGRLNLGKRVSRSGRSWPQRLADFARWSQTAAPVRSSSRPAVEVGAWTQLSARTISRSRMAWRRFPLRSLNDDDGTKQAADEVPVIDRPASCHLRESA